MCGIAGYVGSGDQGELEAMVAAIAHRGPDHKGYLVRGNVALGHARLSIIDTSAGAHQPMLSSDERYAVVFNGEIYNFKALRSELEKGGCVFRTSSDTEVILQLYEREGHACFEKLSGMFAIALYDFKSEELVLARDRMGEKPLYWSLIAGVCSFASEPKALLAHARGKPSINEQALQYYLQYDYVPTPLSIFDGVYKLEPASYLVYKNGQTQISSFWHPPAMLTQTPERETLRELDSLLRETVSCELVSDVPIGVFLSGGLDSSTIAYYAQSASPRPIETFSIGFDEAAFDESSYARCVAEHLGTKHHERIVRASDVLALVPQLGDVLDEPMADASILPTMLLSQFAHEHVTVALGGDGGDELFAGYPTFKAEQAYKWYVRLPEAVRALTANVADRIPDSHQSAFSASFALKKFVSGSPESTARRHSEWLGTFDESARQALLSREPLNTADYAQSRLQEYSAPDTHNALLWMYARTYLMDQVLVKVDRASMHYALETRAPFLDHKMVDYVFSLPFALKYHHGKGKMLLKNLMRDKLPAGIAHRRKKGFGVPMAQWLAGPLRPLCEELLSSESLRAQGVFDPAYVRGLVERHMQGNRDYRKELWNLMVFQLWYRRWMV